MSLLSRLTIPNANENGISQHAFVSALAEYKRGAPGVNLDSIATTFGLSQSEKNSLQEFLSNLDGNSIDRHLISDVLKLGAEFNVSGSRIYTQAQCKSRLGIT